MVDSMTAPDIPFGPWKEIFSGTWTDYDISLSENPDKLTLTIIFEKDKDKVTGMVFVLQKFFVAEGDPMRLSGVLGGYNIIFEKMYPSFKKKYFVISSPPKYAKAEKEEIDSAMQEIFDIIEDQSERANELCKSYEVSLTELKYAKEEEISKLFSEPILMPAISVQRSDERAAMKITARTLLGRKSTGEKAEENVQSFLTTLLIGSRQERKDMVHVVVENCVLSGVTTIVFDDDKSYERMASPNKGFDYKSFPDIQPIGMPLKNLGIQDVGLDLNMLTPEMFREVIGVVAQSGDYLGKVAAELIDESLHECRGRMKSLADLEEKLLTVKEEVKKFHIYKAIRIVKIMEMAYPRFFTGNTDLTQLISPYLKSIGSVVRIDTGNLPEEMKSAFLYSVITTLYRKYKEELATKEVKAVCFVVDGDKIAPVDPQTSLQRGMLATLSDCQKYGVGICLGAEHEIDINSAVGENATIKMETISENEIAMKETHSRPYRMKMRPNLSA